MRFYTFFYFFILLIGLRHGLITWSNRELQVGSRCVINFNEQNKVIRRHGYIQQMTPNKGPVLVFVEEIGEKYFFFFFNSIILMTVIKYKFTSVLFFNRLTVSFESLEVLPLPSNSSNQSEETASDYHTELSLVNGILFDLFYSYFYLEFLLHINNLLFLK